MWINDINEGLGILIQVIGRYKCAFQKITGGYHTVIFWLDDTNCYVWNFEHKILWRVNQKTYESDCLFENGKIVD